jgi:hypothetical protein
MVGRSKGLKRVGRAGADLVSTVVPGNFFTEDEYVLVAEHFFLHRLVQRISDSHLCPGRHHVSMRAIRSNGN